MRWDFGLARKLKWMKGDGNMVKEVYMELMCMVLIGKMLLEKERYTRLDYLVDNTEGNHH